MKEQPKILFYDIETTPLKAYFWRLGQQFVGHKQLCKDMNMYNIICITYCWNDGEKAKAMVFDYETQDCSKIIKEFDVLIREADLTIGKNSDRFDVKHINTQRMLTQDYGMPEWAVNTDDLEKQIRRFFALPSYSLDYLSELMGIGGKMDMEFQDWIDIVEKNKNGRKALKKMVTYGTKDVEDTRYLWDRLSKHFRPRFNRATFAQEHVCTSCGSGNIYRNGTRVAGKTRKQQWFCKDHGGFAGYTCLPYKYPGEDPKAGN